MGEYGLPAGAVPPQGKGHEGRDEDGQHAAQGPAEVKGDEQAQRVDRLVGDDEDAPFDGSAHDGPVRTVDSVLVDIEVGIDPVAGHHQQDNDQCPFREGGRGQKAHASFRLPPVQPSELEENESGGRNAQIQWTRQPDEAAEVAAFARQGGTVGGHGQSREGASMSSVCPSTVRA